jgi:hypothetical protein
MAGFWKTGLLAANAFFATCSGATEYFLKKDSGTGKGWDFMVECAVVAHC